jgi:hypothetical protein
MAECVCLAGCPFFNDRMKDMLGVAAMYKSRYCMGDPSSCARHMIFEKLGKAAVPPDIYPNMVDRAQRILAAGS